MKIYLLPFYCTFFLQIIISFSPVNAQLIINVPYGAASTIDGTFSPGEWDDANMLVLTASPQTKVLYKHDSSNFYIAFAGNLQSGNKFPEILLDINNAKTSGWQDDDWWFHVSATDCEYKAEYGNYD